MQGAVELSLSAEFVEAGDLLPVLVGRGDDGRGRRLVEEALQVPAGELLGVFGGVRFHQLALLLGVGPPELELQVADGGGALGQTVQQQVEQHDRGNEQPAQNLWSPSTHGMD